MQVHSLEADAHTDMNVQGQKITDSEIADLAFESILFLQFGSQRSGSDQICLLLRSLHAVFLDFSGSFCVLFLERQCR
jgi:hypothetical protein